MYAIVISPKLYFNPRSPHGERPRHGDGARVPRHISTHAPRTGSDFNNPSLMYVSLHFNPRSPHGERRGADADFLAKVVISTHAPRTGSDVREPQRKQNFRISTHAPRTGSDKAPTLAEDAVK